MRSTIAAQMNQSSSAPIPMSAATPSEPSAFIATSVQSPSSTSQVSTCSPAPLSEAAQKVWSSGGPEGAPPENVSYFSSKGQPSKSSTLSRETEPR